MWNIWNNQKNAWASLGDWFRYVYPCTLYILQFSIFFLWYKIVPVCFKVLADPAAIVAAVRPSCSPFLWYSPPQSLLYMKVEERKYWKGWGLGFYDLFEFFSENGFYGLRCSSPNSATTDPLNQCFLIPSSRSRRLRNFLSFLGLILFIFIFIFPFFNLPAVDENVDTGVDDQ